MTERKKREEQGRDRFISTAECCPSLWFGVDVGLAVEKSDEKRAIK